MLHALMQLLRGEPAEDIVFTADIAYWISARQHDGSASPDWNSEEGFLRLHRELGILPYYYYDKFFSARECFDDTVSLSSETHGHRTITRFATPRGVVWAESVFLPESCCQGTTKHFVENERDLDILQYLLEHRRFVPANLDDYHDRMERWATGDGLPGLGLPRSPLPSFMYEWAGIQQGVYLLHDANARVREILQLIEDQQRPVIDAVCAIAPPLVHFPDNLASDSLTGYFDAYMAEPYRRRLDRLHAAGSACVVHLDGAAKGLLPGLAAIGFDAVEALTPAPAGDIGLGEMRALVGDRRTILWGGLPGAMFAPPYTWEDVRGHLEALLAAWQGHPFVIGVADQVPPDGDISLCRKISDLLAGR